MSPVMSGPLSHLEGGRDAVKENGEEKPPWPQALTAATRQKYCWSWRSPVAWVWLLVSMRLMMRGSKVLEVLSCTR